MATVNEIATSNNHGSFSTVGIPVATAPGAGSRIVVGVCSTNGIASSVTDSKGNTWVEDGTQPGSAGIAAFHTDQDVGTLTTSDTITIHFSASVANYSAYVQEIVGLTTDAVDQTATGSFSSTTTRSAGTTGTTAQADEIVIAFFSTQTTETGITPAAGYNNFATPFINDPRSKAVLSGIYQIVSSEASYSPTATGGVSASGVGLSFTYKASPTGGPKSVSGTVAATSSVGGAISKPPRPLTVGTISASSSVGGGIGAAFPTTPILDDFSQFSAAGPLTEESQWSGPLAGNSNIRINDNAPNTINPSGAVGGNWWNQSQFGPDAEAYIDIVAVDTLAANYIKLGIRVQNPDSGSLRNCYDVRVIAPDQWQLAVEVNNSRTLLATTTQTVAAGDKIGIRATGSRIQAWWYDSSVGQWKLLMAATDTTITVAGYHLVQIQGSATSSEWTLDNFGGGSSGKKTISGAAISATSTVSGSTGLTKAVAGTISAASSIAGSLQVRRAVAGTISALSTVSAVVAARRRVAPASISATSSVSGSLRRLRHFSGTISATSSVSGSLRVTRAVRGTVSATSSISGAVMRRVAGLVGAVSALSTVSGNVIATHVIHGTVAATSAVSGSTGRIRHFVGSISATSAVSGTFRSGRGIFGVISAASTVSGNIGRKRTPFTGAISALSVVSGSLRPLRKIIGTVSAISVVSGKVTATHVIRGSIAATSSVAAQVLRLRPISGAISAISTLSGLVRKASGIAGTVSALSTVSAARIYRQFPTTGILDDFSQFTVAGPLTSETQWSGPTAGNSNIRINDNVVGAVNPSAAVGGDWWNPAQYGPDVEAYIDIVAVDTLAANYIKLGVRVQNPDSATARGCYDVRVIAPNQWQLAVEINNSRTLLATTTQAVANGDKVGIRAVGNSIQAWWYDSSVGQWKLMMAVTDSTYTGAGFIFMQIQGSAVSTQWTLDNFGGGTYVSGARIISGTITGTSSISGSIKRGRTVSGTISAVSTVGATLEGFKTVIGTISATSVVSAPIGKRFALTGTIAAVTGVNGRVRATHRFQGAISATSTTTGNVAVFRPLHFGAISAASVIAGNTFIFRGISGTIVATSMLSGTVAALHVTTAAISATSTVSGIAHVIRGILPASISANSVVTSRVQIIRGIRTGVISATSVASGRVIRRAAIRGTVSATSTIVGNVLYRRGISGTIVATSTVRAGAVQPIRGTITATSNVSGVLIKIAHPSGVISAISIVTGKLARIRSIRGIIMATSEATGAVVRFRPVSGGISAFSTVTGLLRASRGLSGGHILATSTFSGSILRFVGATGTISATSTVIGRVRRIIVTPLSTGFSPTTLLAVGGSSSITGARTGDSDLNGAGGDSASLLGVHDPDRTTLEEVK